MLRSSRCDRPFAQNHVAPEQELLGTLAGVHLGGELVALRVHREIVDPVEVARLPAIAAEAAEDLARVATERADFVVRPVGVDQVGFALVRP